VEEELTEVLKMVPSRIGRNKTAQEQFSGMIVDGQQQCLLLRGKPPLVDGRVVLPQFIEVRAFPAAARLGGSRRFWNQVWEMGADKGGHGLAVPFKAKAKLQFISDELKIGRALEREKVPEKLANQRRPIWPVITTREPRAKMGTLFKPAGFESVKVSSANLEQLGGLAGIDLTLVELGEDLQQEGVGQSDWPIVF
jgi:hypothetical protein